MRKIVLTVATVVFLYAIAVGAAPGPPLVGGLPTPSQAQSAPQSPAPQIQTFLGTITKTGNQYILNDDVSKNSYQLDDQQTASRFYGRKVKVTGTLDAASNLIRMQSIAATA